ncbi:nitrate- and nitrite sensing domain-containing protein [Nonomuraea sp. K274]|uniref:histidine kinase n=1 Tax=Nonomuraea cypriaca TaxID=1187855 RepID=A0A931F3T7_9ACTN|nr:nitrate- and nitrite sensing domain-containing protein [Nonomuraea cypriaca]MBF8190446.1 nitrate- and nitrite sensing domain-containing protein [Nonomuraea cypriaca]
MLALIIIPTLAAVVLGGFRVTTSVGSAIEYEQINKVAVLAGKLAGLTHALELERDLTAAFVAQGRRPTGASKMEAQYTAVDQAVGQVRADIDALATSDVPERAEAVQIGNRLDELANARKAASGTQLETRTVIRLYEQIIRDITVFNDDLDRGAVDEELADGVAAFAALARAKESSSRERAILMTGIVSRRLSPALLDDFLVARSQRDTELATFRAHATIAQRELYDNTVSGQLIDRGEGIRSRALVLTAEGRLLVDKALGARNGDLWFQSSTETIERMRKAEANLAEAIILRSRMLQESEQRSALLIGVAIAALLLVVVVVTTVMARSLVRPLRRLRGEALHIAGQRLPETVRQLRESGSLEQPAVSPIGVDSQDEIGEVARAFDEVHREAIRLAGEESRLRSNVNAMFVNLSRRSQTLVERQITLIDGLEQGEQDEQRLGNLFKLDHLATRMRRNSENLLVLAGQEPPRRWSQPVKLVDVARASLSEVENYERVVLEVPEGVSIAGQAVNDIIHLLAELIENALSFSPRETRVPVSGSRIDGGGIMLSISDSGIGMTQEELVQANDRLTDAPTVDVSVSRRMGLFVVARLAHRHGIRVQLRPHGSGGLTAMVLLPETLLGTQAPSYAGSAPATAPREEAFPTPQPAAAGPWPAGSYQMGPGHPSYPGNPSYPSYPSTESASPSGSWPASPQWPAETPSWMSSSSPASAPAPGPASQAPAPSSFDSSSDVWVPSRGPATGEHALPQRGLPDLPQRGVLPDDTRPWTRAPEQPRPQRFDFPETESAETGPIPVVKPASAGDEYLPIFASVESRWFDHASESDATWGSAKADAGWSAAEAVVEPVRDGSTAAGLPKRVPKANLVPGSADTVSAPKGVAPMPAVSPERVRSRLSSFQQGFRAARDDISEGRAHSSGPRSDSREEGA